MGMNAARLQVAADEFRNWMGLLPLAIILALASLGAPLWGQSGSGLSGATLQKSVSGGTSASGLRGAGAISVRGANAIVPTTCTSAGISAALASLPATGGTVDASGCSGNVTLSGPGPIIIGPSSTQPETLILGSGFYNCAMTSGNCFQLNGSGSQLIGQATNNTFITCSSGFT